MRPYGWFSKIRSHILKFRLPMMYDVSMLSTFLLGYTDCSPSLSSLSGNSFIGFGSLQNSQLWSEISTWNDCFLQIANFFLVSLHDHPIQNVGGSATWKNSVRDFKSSLQHFPSFQVAKFQNQKCMCYSQYPKNYRILWV